MDEKQLLNGLILSFIDKKITVRVFCEEFSRIYDQELDYDKLNTVERKAFKELAEMTGRYSPYPDDIKKYKCYFDDEQIENKAREVSSIIDLDKRS